MKNISEQVLIRYEPCSSFNEVFMKYILPVVNALGISLGISAVLYLAVQVLLSC